MIFITAKFRVLPEHADNWPEIAGPFTRATRGEPGCMWFEWSRSLENPDQFVLLEAFRDAKAGAEHVGSEHFKKATQQMPSMLVKIPQIVNVEVPGGDWSELGEFSVPDSESG